ncbi:MAG: S8 family serine peptidase, partial [Bifidobacteriaceae bacterium]|nr:S8 family serine peptidase [Bifidobacteriaceae bacterium]
MTNPLAVVPRPKPEPKPVVALTAQGVGLIRRAVRRHDEMHQAVSRRQGGPAPRGDVPALLNVILGTGLRIGEVLALRWRDVVQDGETWLVDVNATMVELTGLGQERQPARQLSGASMHDPAVGVDGFATAPLTMLEETMFLETIPVRVKHLRLAAPARWRARRRLVAVAAAGALTTALGLAGPAVAAPPETFDPARGCTVLGTALGDVLRGTDGDDVICGGGGGDTILAGAGNDVVYGDAGGDTIYAGNGDDTVYGGDGGDGGDTVYGEDGGDRVFGGAGGDTIWGGAGADMLDGEDGADTLRGGDGPDRLVGGLKADTAWGDAGDDLVVGGDGADSVKGNAGADVLLGGPGGDSHYGDAGADVCVDGEGVNAFYSCDTKAKAADYGGVAGDADGDGVSDEDEARGGTDPLVADQTVLSYGLDVVAGCEAGLALSVAARSDVVTEGDQALFDVVARNDPAGSCLASAGAPATVAGVLTATAPAQGEGGGFEALSAWLEVPGTAGAAARTVLPTSSGLTAMESAGPAGCPGGTAEGCAVIGALAGYANVTGGQAQDVAAGETQVIGFRYFPVLGSADLALLTGGGEVRLAVAVIEPAGGLAVLRVPVSVGTASPTGVVTVVADLPGGAASQVTLPSVAAGQQAEALGAFSYTTSAADGHSLTAHFTATAPGVAEAASAEVVVTVESRQKDGSPLESAIYPKSANVGAATEFTVSARPGGTVSDGPVIAWESGSVMLTDDGEGGDLVAGDGVYTAKFSWAPAAAGLQTLTVAGVVDGKAASGQVQIAVYANDVPTSPYTGTHAGTVSDGETDYYSDMIVILAESGADFALVAEAASSVGGIVVGAFLRDGWQILVPAAASFEDLVAAAQALAANPVVVLVDLEGVGSADEDTIEPNDPWYPNQQYLDDFGLDDAWAFNTGRVRMVVAVLDNGFDVAHPDLDDNITAGWDYGSGDDNVAPDCGDHGTHVAGIAGAESNNGIGVTGVNWNVELLVHKVFSNDTCQWSQVALAEAISSSVASGARVINMSLGVYGQRNWMVAQALDQAFEHNVVTVATAGNDGVDTLRYPAAYERSEDFHSIFHPDRVYNTDVLAVGNMTTPTQRNAGSTFGDWVQFWAPGTNILSTVVGGGTGEDTGTSMAAPFVSGLASLILSHPNYLDQGPAYVRSRLQSTSSGHAPGQQGWVVDGYQAVSNASFEAGMATVNAEGAVTTVESLGSITPRAGWGQKMLQLSTGATTAQQQLHLLTGPVVGQRQATASLDLRPPVDALSDRDLRVDLCYNYVTEEYPEWVGSRFNDEMQIRIVGPPGIELGAIDESVADTNWTIVTGVDFPGGDSTVGQSGWKCGGITVPRAALDWSTGFAPAWRLWIVVEDRGDT